MLFYVLGDKMLRIVDDKWLLDTEAMICSIYGTEICFLLFSKKNKCLYKK